MGTFKKAIAKAREAAGGGAALARGLKLRRQAVYQWDKVPSHHVLSVERLTKVSRHELRPDLYPDPKTEQAGAA